MRWNFPLLIKQNRIKSVLSASIISSLVMMAGCASRPVVTATTRSLQIVPEFYTVQPGDSLGRIAARYGLNYNEIAQLNNISVADKIYVHQSLRLKASDRINSSAVKTTALEQTPAIQQQSMATQAAPSTAKNKTVIPLPVKPVTSSPVLPVNSGQLKWVVPSQGALIGRFNPAQDQKGIRFGGKIGDPIIAAAQGEVVYADDGLKEYGKLILLRHSNGYITAYAHNNKILVKVGEKVKVGQRIAEMGNTGAKTVMLEFQIRLDGKPIDPLSVLPLS